MINNSDLRNWFLITAIPSFVIIFLIPITNFKISPTWITKPWFNGAEWWFETLLYDVSVGILVSWFFYYIVAYLPQKKKEKSLDYPIRNALKNVVGSSEIIRFQFKEICKIDFEHNILLTTDEVKQIWNFLEKTNTDHSLYVNFVYHLGKLNEALDHCVDIFSIMPPDKVILIEKIRENAIVRQCDQFKLSLKLQKTGQTKGQNAILGMMRIINFQQEFLELFKVINQLSNQLVTPSASSDSKKITNVEIYEDIKQ